jgi:hypothetical protein
MSVPAVWRRLQRWEWVFWIAFPAALLAALAAVVLPGWSYQYDIALYAATSLGAVAIVALIRAGFFRCPRCGKLFSVRIGRDPFPGRKPSSRHCLNCWLPKWADPDTEPEDEWPESRDEDW